MSKKLVMKIVNFVNPWRTEEEGRVFSVVVDCWANGLPYEQVRDTITEQGYKLPKEQWDAFSKVLDIQYEIESNLPK